MQRFGLILRLLLAIVVLLALIPSLIVSAALCPEIVFSKTKWIQARPSMEKAKFWVLHGSKRAGGPAAAR